LEKIASIPNPTDDFVDFGDLLTGMHEIMSAPETEQLVQTFNRTIIESSYWGEDFSNTTGLTVWYPDEYRQFKQLLSRYMPLLWTGSKWLELLNWLYQSDDLRPTTISVTAGNIGGNNDFKLGWTRAFDLSPVTYDVVEATDTTSLFHDPCEDSSNWILDGFSLSTTVYHSGGRSFFSGNASNMQSKMETKENIVIEEIGLLDIFLHYNTEDINDSLIIQYGPFQEIHYGSSNGWIERRVLLPAGEHPLRISYRTSSATNLGGCYVDDIAVYNMAGGHTIRSAYADTSILIYNEARGTHLYAVWAEDNFKNRGNVSNLLQILIEEYAVPYSVPNPFQTSCYIVLDYPESLNPVVEIYSLSGILVRRFNAQDQSDGKIYWNGKNDAGYDIAAGLYFVLVKDNGFQRIGKIARQR